MGSSGQYWNLPGFSAVPGKMGDTYSGDKKWSQPHGYAETASSDVTIPKKIGEYAIAEKGLLGKGGMGVVYKGYDNLNRTVAIKVLKEDNDDKLREKRKRRFEREAKALACLKHSNIVTVYKYGVENDQSYIAMEYIDGPTLREKIRSGEVPDAPELLWRIGIFKDVLKAVEYAHNVEVSYEDGSTLWGLSIAILSQTI